MSGCALTFDSVLRDELDPGFLARALRPNGSFTDPYLRAAMRRMGDLSVDNSVEFVDGTQLRPESPIELEMAMSNSAGARGFLVLLRSFVAGLEVERRERVESLRSLLAPELRLEEFTKFLSRAQAQEEECRASD